MVFNTVWLSRSIRADFDTEMRRKADLASQVFGISIKQNLSSQPELQTALEDIIASSDESIINTSVAVQEGSAYRILASNDTSLINASINDVQFSQAMTFNNSVSSLVSNTADASVRAWRTVTPITDSDGKIIALSSVDISSAKSDELINKTLRQSFIVLIVTVFVVALLLANHFRFVEYAQLTKKLEEADRLKTDFLSVASHELKAPMSIIKGYISNVLDGTLGEVSDQIKDNLKIAFAQTDRLNNLVADLLNVSRIEQGEISFDIKAIEVTSVINPIIEQYRSKAKDKNIELNYEQPKEALYIQADQGRYQEIMTNLIDNAIKYSLKGVVTVRHESDNKTVKTRVRDNGIGLSAEERSNLFQRFYRARNEQTKDIGGTGLGLWIIKQYTQKMGGKIYADSLEGEGSEFTVELPRTNGPVDTT